MAKYLDEAGLGYYHGKVVATFVAKEDGKGLSEANFTAAEKTKLEGIAEGAQVNVIESVSVDGTPLAIDSKGVNIDLTAYAKLSDIASAYNYKGTVDTYAELPTADQKVGDVYNIVNADPTNGINAGDNVAWTGDAWDVLAGTVDLSGYVTKADYEAGTGLPVIQNTDIDALFTTGG